MTPEQMQGALTVAKCLIGLSFLNVLCVGFSTLFLIKNIWLASRETIARLHPQRPKLKGE